MSEPCICCGNESTLLCDFVLGFQLFATLPYKQVGGDLTHWTCDAPLCATCATFAGNRFYCGSSEFAGVESVDYCPAHKDARHKDTNPIMAADAEYLRRQVWAKLRRTRMTARPPNE